MLLFLQISLQSRVNAAILDPLVSSKYHQLKRLNHIFSCAVESGSGSANANNANATESSCLQDSLLLLLHLLRYALSHLRSSSSSSSHNDHQQQQLMHATIMTSPPPVPSSLALSSTFVSSQALPTQEHMVDLPTKNIYIYTYI